MCIIDFSRSIINPEHHKIFHQKNGKHEYLQNDQHALSKDRLLKNQIEYLSSYLYSIKPEYKEFSNIIENNMKYHFDEYFKVLSALDIYNITSKILTFTNYGKKIGKINKNSKTLVTNINISANYYLTTVFEKLLNTNNYTEFIDMEWPLLSIIQDVFNNRNNAKDGNNEKDTEINNIVDIYSYSNKMTK